MNSFDRMHGFMTSSRHTEIIDIRNGDSEQIIIVEVIVLIFLVLNFIGIIKLLVLC